MLTLWPCGGGACGGMHVWSAVLEVCYMSIYKMYWCEIISIPLVLRGTGYIYRGTLFFVFKGFHVYGPALCIYYACVMVMGLLVQGFMYYCSVQPRLQNFFLKLVLSRRHILCYQYLGDGKCIRYAIIQIMDLVIMSLQVYVILIA